LNEETGPDVIEEMFIENNIEIMDPNDKITIIDNMDEWLSPCFENYFY
jgi:hypothetical protein